MEQEYEISMVDSYLKDFDNTFELLYNIWLFFKKNKDIRVEEIAKIYEEMENLRILMVKNDEMAMNRYNEIRNQVMDYCFNLCGYHSLGNDFSR